MKGMEAGIVGSGTKARRWTLGLLVAMTVIGAAALSGSVGGKPGSGSSSGEMLPMEEFALSYRMSIEWPSGGGTSDGIDVDSWSWGVSQTGSTGGGGGAGRAEFQDLVVTKDLDKSSTKLMQACASGQHIKKVVLEFLTTDKKGTESPYMVVTMEDVLITSFQTGGSSGDPLPTEQVSFAYSKITWEYMGPGAESGDTFGWDLSENQSA